MATSKFIIPSDNEEDEAAETSVKRHFKPGAILEGIRQEQDKRSSERKSESTDPQSRKPVERTVAQKQAGEASKQDGRPPDQDENCLQSTVQGQDRLTGGPSGSSFEAAFENLKSSKFYEQPSEPKATDSPKKPESYPLKTGSVLVNPRQKGNPLLKNIHNVPWEFLEIEPDYIMGKTTCALFLSLRYFNLYPNYIHDRLKSLGKSFQLRILLVLVDVADPYPPLRDLSRIAIYTDCTLVLAWSSEEAGKYIETYKILENKSADTLMEKQDDDAYSKVVDSLTKVKSVNQTNATTLLTTYGSLDKVLRAQPDELALLPGIGPQKAKKLHTVIHQPFLKSK